MGSSPPRSRPSPLACAAAALAILAAAGARAAEPTSSGVADVKRAVAAVSLSSSEAPAVRAEQQMREPSPAFRLGAAYAAWSNAAAQLDFDIQNPTAAGPPHASQSGALSEFMAQDCRDEATAFAQLESRSQALGLTPRQVGAAAGAAPASVSRWQARKAGPAPACR